MLRHSLGVITKEYEINDLIGRIDKLDPRGRSPLMPPPVAEAAAAITERFGAAAAGRHGKLLVLELIRRFAVRVTRQNLPQSVLALYPAMLGEVARSLQRIEDERYFAPHSDAAKDIRLAAGLSVPVGASQLVDLSSFLPETFYRYQGWRTNLGHLRFVLFRLGGMGPLLRSHTDTRNLADFTKAGWERCYLRMAELLRAFPHIRGLVGTSWLHDPQLARVTPHLRYLGLPVEHGAWLRWDGPDEIQTQWALAQSQRRRKLYEEGKYQPTCYTMVWPRRDLLRWADNQGGGRP
jgi:hypothetical protein